LDVDVDAGRQVDAHQGVDRLRRRVEDVDETLVGPHLEVLATVLVLVRRADDAVHVLLRRQRHRPDDAGAGTRHRLDDLARAGVNGLVVIGLEPDADLLSSHSGSSVLTVDRCCYYGCELASRWSGSKQWSGSGGRPVRAPATQPGWYRTT